MTTVREIESKEVAVLEDFYSPELWEIMHSCLKSDIEENDVRIFVLMARYSVQACAIVCITDSAWCKPNKRVCISSIKCRGKFDIEAIIHFVKEILKQLEYEEICVKVSRKNRLLYEVLQQLGFRKIVITTNSYSILLKYGGE